MYYPTTPDSASAVIELLALKNIGDKRPQHSIFTGEWQSRASPGPPGAGGTRPGRKISQKHYEAILGGRFRSLEFVCFLSAPVECSSVPERSGLRATTLGRGPDGGTPRTDNSSLKAPRVPA